MKKSVERFYYSDKAVEYITAIIKAEDLESITATYESTILGDDVIVVRGLTEEVKLLKDIYEMVL